MSEATQSCLTLCDPMDCSLLGSSVHRIFKARMLEWVAISFSKGSSQPRDQTQVSCIVGGCFTVWTTREVSKTLLNNVRTRKKLFKTKTYSLKLKLNQCTILNMSIYHYYSSLRLLRNVSKRSNVVPNLQIHVLFPLKKQSLVKLENWPQTS